MFILGFKNEDLHTLVFHSARLENFGSRGASEEEDFSRSSDIGEQREAKMGARKNENEGGEGGFSRSSLKCPSTASCLFYLPKG